LKADDKDGSDFRRLGKVYRDSGQHFLSYLFNLSYFYLEEDKGEKFKAGMDALYSCVEAKRVEEGLYIVQELQDMFPEESALFDLYFIYILVSGKDFRNVERKFSTITVPKNYEDQYYFLRSYSLLSLDRAELSLKELRKIGSSFKEYGEVLTIIHDIEKEPELEYKSRAAAFTMSMFLKSFPETRI